ncbi:Uncharacterised protein [uncultured archaeon]|nr:Uncharacterised protein [uncultured archaeon]
MDLCTVKPMIVAFIALQHFFLGKMLDEIIIFLWMEIHFCDIASDSFLAAGEAEDLYVCGVADQDPALWGSDEIPCQIILEKPIISLLALTQRLFGPLALCDISDYGDGSRFSLAVSENGVAYFSRESSSILTSVSELGLC